MREVDILLDWIQEKFDDIALNQFEIKPEISVIAHTAEQYASLEQDAFKAIQRQIDERKIVGILKTSASRYAFGDNVSFNWTVSFNINVAIKDDIIHKIEQVRKELKKSESSPVKRCDRQVSISVNMTSVFNVQQQSGGMTYVQCLMSGSCTVIGGGGVLGVSFGCELKLPNSTSYEAVNNILAIVPASEIKIDDRAVSGSIIRDLTPITADGLSGFIVQFDDKDDLHNDLLDYALDHTELFDNGEPVKIGYKITLNGNTVKEWSSAVILKCVADIKSSDYVTIHVDIGRSL